MDILARHAFGLGADPWAVRNLRTADAARTELLVGAAAHAQAMVWIVGPRGSGKSHAVRRALDLVDASIVEPLRLDKERLHLGDIQAAIVRDLSNDERVRRSGEARSGQVRRLLGLSPRRTVLVIEEAHVLHPSTIRGLKRLRELGWHARKAPLIGVVLVGQRDAAAHIPEVGLRSDRMTFAGLTAREAATAVTQAINAEGEVMTAEAVELLSRSGRARNWLDLQAAVDACLAQAHAAGLEQVDAATVRTALNQAEDSGAAPAAAGPADDAAIAERLRRSVA